MSHAALTVGQARAQYFADAGFPPPDGGYAAKFVKLAQVGPIPLGFPNSDARRRAVGLHDLHHVATGFKTDNRIGLWLERPIAAKDRKPERIPFQPVGMSRERLFHQVPEERPPSRARLERRTVQDAFQLRADRGRRRTG